jgi:predicted AAA+ superfamily ATPase
MIQRKAKKKLIQLASKFKAVAVTGARQTGKTTLIKEVFRDKPYVSLENLDMRNFALEDPRGFLSTYPNGAVLDEVQRTPNLFSYLQEILDNSKVKGLFILSGSNNFLLQQSISQSLSGRIGYINLLPFSIAELSKAKLLPDSDDELLVKGFYPPVYDQDIPVVDWCPNYIRTYIEKDVRQIKNINDLIVFEKFVRLLAGRTGQELNSNSISIEVGIDIKTIQSWIGILESSFIIYLLKPHYNNYNKTIIKRPKLYFYDTSIVCSLLGIQNAQQMSNYPLRGAIFETMVINEFVKKRTNAAMPINLFYWREKTGHEIDLIMDNGGDLLPIEIKSGQTINSEFFRNIDYWCKLSGTTKSVLMYAGDQKQKRSNGTDVMNWRELISLEN